MSWVDAVADEIAKQYSAEISAGTPLIIRDEKTLSGRVHVGSLRGIVIHALVAQALQQKGIDCVFRFELNDFDPMDDIPRTIDQESFREHMGKPLYTVPSIEEGHENFPSVFGDELQGVVDQMHLPIEFFPLRPYYQDGSFNETIEQALNAAAAIRTIYLEVSGGGKPDDWYPLNTVCEKCGRIGTTQVTSWDPDKKTVTYHCKKDLVKWAEGCDHQGEISPFDGNAKLPWKVEWAAKWKVYGVHIEGAGKDHYAAGGSREIAARISEEIFKYPTPFDIPYEFLNFGGKKMSSSKGIGASAKEISDLLPPALLKLLLIRKKPNQPIDFDAAGKTIPNLFDEYDRLSDHYFKRHPEPRDDYARTFALTQLDVNQEPEDLWQMRFTVLSFIVQMPHLDLVEEAEKLKGTTLSENEQFALEERAHYVRHWIEHLASDEYKFVIQEDVPADLELSSEQKETLSKLSDALEDPKLTWEGALIHEAIHAVKEKSGIAPKDLFQPLYKIFLNRTSGPQVGWFLSTFERSAVVEKLKTVSA